MKISFLVTYYQQARFVRESMDSILALEKPAEWEVLIGDDGSDDGTLEEARRYADRDPEHIRLFVMPREAGRKYNSVLRASANRLNLVRNASGDCYCLMDGDDFYSETDFIPGAVAALERDPGVSVVALDTWMYRDGAVARRKAGGSREARPVHRKRYLRWMYTHAGACVFRNSHTAEELALLEEMGSFDDNDIVLSALARGRMVRIPRPVYAYRQAEGSVYTSMAPAEQAALNLYGMGVALRLMGPAWERDVTARYATAVWMGWFLRRRLREGMTPEKYQTYLEGCRRAVFPRGERLMRYPELGKPERREIRRWVCRAGWASPPRVAYAWLRTCGRRRQA